MQILMLVALALRGGTDPGMLGVTRGGGLEVVVTTAVIPGSSSKQTPVLRVGFCGSGLLVDAKAV